MFDYRIAYGCWLNDSRLWPIAEEDWPSVRIDEGTLESWEKTARFLQSAGYNWVDVFGLVTNNNWNTDVASTVSADRVELVREVIGIIRRHGMKVIYGLGVYSWGFERIIAENEGVRGTSAQVMCASSAQSEDVMRRVIRFLADTFDFDGYHLEAADQGRCNCPKCARIADDIDYYNAINQKTARYIRATWPEKVLLVNTSGYLPWGEVFTPEQLEQVATLGNEVDIFIDVGSHGAFVRVEDRESLVLGMKASFGTANGFWVYPPQRWERNRWFLPHFMANSRHLKALYDDGGRSSELYLSPISNPGAEMTQFCNGLFLQDPSRPAPDILQDGVGMLYEPSSAQVRDRIADLFLHAEELFFRCWNPVRDRTLPTGLTDGVEYVFLWSARNPERAVPGEIFLEPLWGIGAGFPCWLTVHFTRQGRADYLAGLRGLLAEAESLADQERSAKLTLVADCIQNMINDLLAVREMLGEE